jgi:pilus assembly protein Flp/PilA
MKAGAGSKATRQPTDRTELAMAVRIARSVSRFLRAEDGPTATEYAVMLALILTVIIVSVAVIGTQTNTMYGNLTLKTSMDPTASS